MAMTPPNSGFGGMANRGSSAGPMKGPSWNDGRGSAPTGDRFHLPAPPANAFPNGVEAPSAGVVPIYPPDRVEANIPQMAWLQKGK